MAPGVLERHLQYADITSSAHTTAVASAVAFLFFVYQLLVYLGFPLLSPLELFWNAIVYICPASLLLDTKGEVAGNLNMFPQTHAVKSEALRNLFGSGCNKVLQNIPGTGAAIRRASLFSSSRETTSDAPPGLGNWDNSCYQNSVLQGLSSLSSLKKHLEHTDDENLESATTTTSTLREVIHKLSGSANNGRHLWTPAKLKSMSSWQQQDAQEYFSKVMEELDKEAIKFVKSKRLRAGLEAAVARPGRTAEHDEELRQEEAKNRQNPLEGLIAQRVACTSCGFSEGLSMIPFNCLTVPLGSEFQYSIEQCLDQYTDLEDITEVECSKCTLLRAEQQLMQLVRPEKQAQESDAAESAAALSLPPEVRAQIAARLQAVQKALVEDDFADKTLYETCQISKKSRVSSTKTRQAVIARGPQSLVLHVNRSVFDEMTGVQRKNYANVRYPLLLNLDPWTLQTEFDHELNSRTAVEKAALSMLRSNPVDSGFRYTLRAVVTHYGRHENGHYIAYRTHHMRQSTSDDKNEADSPSAVGTQDDGEQKVQWWRLSDEDVTLVSEEDVVGQGGVFMLFYERIELSAVHRPVASVPVPAPAVVETKHAMPAGVNDDGLAQEPQYKGVNHENDHESEPRASVRVPLADVARSRDTSATRSSSAGTIEDESDATDYEDAAVSSPPIMPLDKISTPQWMRTAHGRQDSQDEGAFANNVIRPMAAT